MPKFIIVCSWEMSGEFVVDAPTMKAAIAKVEEGKEPYQGLPIGEEYVDASFHVVKEECQEQDDSCSQGKQDTSECATHSQLPTSSVERRRGIAP